MNSVLHRYVLREVVGPFLSATAVLLSLFYALLLIRGVEFLLGSGARPLDWVVLIASMLPMLLPQVLPISLIVGVMIGLARLAEDGELTALGSLGVSPSALVRPALVLGTGVCALLAFTLFLWKPYGITQMRQTAREVIERNILGDLKPGTIRAEIPGIVFQAEAISEGPTWRRVVLIDERDPERISVLTAPVARASFEGGVGLRFSDALLVQRAGVSEYSTTSFTDGLFLFDVGDTLLRRNTFRFGPDELSPTELIEAAENPQYGGDPPSRFWSMFHFRISSLFAPFALVVLATAVAQGGRKRAVRTAAVIGLFVYLGYFILARVGVQLGERGVLPPWVAGHAPTVVALACGLLMLWRVDRRGAR